MAIVFPASPSVNDTFTAGSITYKWDGAKWIGLGVTPADRLVEGSNSLEIDANNDLVWTGNNLKLVDSAETTASLFINGTKKSTCKHKIILEPFCIHMITNHLSLVPRLQMVFQKNSV